MCFSAMFMIVITEKSEMPFFALSTYGQVIDYIWLCIMDSRSAAIKHLEI